VQTSGDGGHAHEHRPLQLLRQRLVHLARRQHPRTEDFVNTVGDLLDEALLIRSPRHPPEREDANVFSRDDVIGSARSPDLDERWILPISGLHVLDAGVQRENRGSRSTVLETTERGSHQVGPGKPVVQMGLPVAETDDLVTPDA
jgi:hypothetical protein